MPVESRWGTSVMSHWDANHSKGVNCLPVVPVYCTLLSSLPTSVFVENSALGVSGLQWTGKCRWHKFLFTWRDKMSWDFTTRPTCFHNTVVFCYSKWQWLLNRPFFSLISVIMQLMSTHNLLFSTVIELMIAIWFEWCVKNGIRTQILRLILDVGLITNKCAVVGLSKMKQKNMPHFLWVYVLTNNNNGTINSKATVIVSTKTWRKPF